MFDPTLRIMDWPSAEAYRLAEEHDLARQRARRRRDDAADTGPELPRGNILEAIRAARRAIASD